MRLWICSDHDAYWIRGTSVVAAEDETHARILLDAELKAHGLKSGTEHPYTLEEVALDSQKVVVIADGDY